MKKTIAVLMSVCLLFTALLPAVFAADEELTRPEKAHVSFNEDGTLKILSVADIQDGPILTGLSEKFIRAAIEKEDPDLILMPGIFL